MIVIKVNMNNTLDCLETWVAAETKLKLDNPSLPTDVSLSLVERRSTDRRNWSIKSWSAGWCSTRAQSVSPYSCVEDDDFFITALTWPSMTEARIREAGEGASPELQTGNRNVASLDPSLAIPSLIKMDRMSWSEAPFCKASPRNPTWEWKKFQSAPLQVSGRWQWDRLCTAR